MSVQIVRFSTDAERIPEVEGAVKSLFAAVTDAAPTGLAHTAARVGDGAEFLLALQLADADANPLFGIQDAGEFRTRITDRAGGPVPPRTPNVLGRYAG